MKKLISVLLAVAVLLCICPRDYQIGATEVQPQAETDLESIIREQIEAFAKSIDQKNADDAAAKALAKHGISSGGKKLSVGKNHALTATLWNSELMQAFLANSCANVIKRMQTSGEDLLYVRGALQWAKFLYTYKIFQEPPKTFALSSNFQKTIAGGNPYDTSLVWIVGGAYTDIKLWKLSETANTITYSLDIVTYDSFDFHASSSNGGFKDFISGIGALLFKKFDWESKVTFQLTVPNECEHTFDDETDSDCNGCGYVREMRGDMNGDSTKNSADAIYLLRHSIMPEMYPLSQAADVNGDGAVNSADAVYLLRHTIMPQAYPLK